MTGQRKTRRLAEISKEMNFSGKEKSTVKDQLQALTELIRSKQTLSKSSKEV
jgi:hypothetical protein